MRAVSPWPAVPRGATVSGPQATTWSLFPSHIGELESRLTLAKQGSSSRPLDALECRGIFLQEGSAGAPALNLFLRLHLLTD